jgi:hypothetical protein
MVGWSVIILPKLQDQSSQLVNLSEFCKKPDELSTEFIPKSKVREF